MISYKKKDIFPMARMTHKQSISVPKIALYEPDIPQNTAAIVRTCSCLGAILEIIEPCGFLFSDKRFKRVVMDYLDKNMIRIYQSADEFFDKKKNERII
jgi:Predicted rRNA methylase (SpoU class)